MGDMVEMMLDGTLCEQCGGMVGDYPQAVGYPRKCEDCKPKKKRRKRGKPKNIKR